MTRWYVSERPVSQDESDRVFRLKSYLELLEADEPVQFGPAMASDVAKLIRYSVLNEERALKDDPQPEPKP